MNELSDIVLSGTNYADISQHCQQNISTIRAVRGMQNSLVWVLELPVLISQSPPKKTSFSPVFQHYKLANHKKCWVRLNVLVFRFAPKRHSKEKPCLEACAPNFSNVEIETSHSVMKLRPDQSLREEERGKWKVRGRGEEWGREEGMKRTQRCIKLFPHRRGVDKKTLSKPEQALHSDGERGQMKENKGTREREGEGETGKKRGERERERG